MSSIESEIAEYKLKIKKHEAKIEKIESHKDYDMAADKWIAVIKSEKDGILACEARILQLGNQQMPGKSKILLIFCFILMTCLPTIYFRPPLGVNRFQPQEPKVYRFLFILLDCSHPISYFLLCFART